MEVLQSPAYSVLFNPFLKAPVFTVHHLFSKPGISVLKKGSLIGNSTTANKSDYLHTGFDKGHMVPVADFANDVNLLPFVNHYINCIPMYPAVNRSMWLKDEILIRSFAASKPIIVVSAAMFGYQTIGAGVAVPINLFKIVLLLHSKKVIMCKSYSNSPRGNSFKYTTFSEVQKMIGCNINLG